MHFLLFGLTCCGILTAFYCLSNTAQQERPEDNYLDLVREIADETVYENELQDKDIEEHNLEQTRKANGPAQTNARTSNDGPYTDKENIYLELARQVADQYMEDRRKENEVSVGARTAADSLQAFNLPSRRTQMIAEQNERQIAELETLQLLASDDDFYKTRNLPLIDLTARPGNTQIDPICSKRINCYDENNLNRVDNIEFRTTDGTCNNKNNYQWGMAGVQHRRLLPNAYHDSIRKITLFMKRPDI